MIAELFILAILVLLAGTIFPLAAASLDRRSVRTLSLSCTIIASILLGILSLVNLLSGEPVSFTLYQPIPAFSLSFVIDRLASFFLLIIAVNAGSGLYMARLNGHEMVEKIGLYWHFVDLVWVFVFLVFYLL